METALSCLWSACVPAGGSSLPSCPSRPAVHPRRCLEWIWHLKHTEESCPGVLRSCSPRPPLNKAELDLVIPGRPDLRRWQERGPGLSWTSSHVRVLLEWGNQASGKKRHLLCARGIHQWFSNLCTRTPGGLVSIQIAGPTPRVSDAVGLG